MKIDGKTTDPNEPIEVITSGGRGAIPLAPVIKTADGRVRIEQVARDVEQLAKVTDGTRARLLTTGLGAVLVLALTAAIVVAKKADFSEGEPLEPVEGLDYEDPILDKEVACLRTEFKDRVDGTTSAWKEGNCNTDALDELCGDLACVSVARSNLGGDAEKWIREGGMNGGMVIRVNGDVFNPGGIDKKFVKPVPRTGTSCTRRVYSK